MTEWPYANTSWAYADPPRSQPARQDRTTPEVSAPMLNQERRAALSEARTKALQFAREAEQARATSSKEFSHIVMLADTWANVAMALKTGDVVHDGC